MSRCKKCGADLIWIKTKTGGKPMPCNAEQVMYWPGRTDKIVTPNGEVISCSLEGNPQEATGVGYVSHFATCPYSGEFRKEKR